MLKIIISIGFTHLFIKYSTLFSTKLNAMCLVRHVMRQHLSALIDMRTSILIMGSESDVLMAISTHLFSQNDETVKTVEIANVPTEMNDLNVRLDNI